eukprot:804567-Pelagomonas_calceolata.AAC.1
MELAHACTLRDVAYKKRNGGTCTKTWSLPWSLPMRARSVTLPTKSELEERALRLGRCHGGLPKRARSMMLPVSPKQAGQ